MKIYKVVPKNEENSADLRLNNVHRFFHSVIEYEEKENNGHRVIGLFYNIEDAQDYLERLRDFDPSRQIQITWDISDVKSERPDLNDEQAMEVLKRVRDKHDADIGVNWATISTWADMLFP